MFVAGLVVGYIAGTRAGRERYDQIVKLSRQFAEHPKVQQATGAVTARTSDLAKTAAARAPDLARRAPEFAKTATEQAKSATASVPKFARTAKEQAASHLPFGGKSADAGGPFGEAGASPGPYPTADPASYNGIGTNAD
jgi:hypothetical protein